MQHFWDYNVWGWILAIATLLGALLVGNMLKKGIPLLKKSLIPTSVIAGVLLLAIAGIYRVITKDSLFDLDAFGGNGMTKFEIITYHALALGFIASTLKSSGNKLTKQRTNEIFNTGVTTVATYILQGIFGLAITMIAAVVIIGFFPAAGILLPFGFGQGSGQALNYGTIYQAKYGFVGGSSFGLAVAALGFLSASIGGIIHLNIAKKRGKLVKSKRTDGSAQIETVESANEIPMQESIDKITVQIALIFTAYALTYILMYALGSLIPGIRDLIFGFNFLIGVLMATLVKAVLNFLNKKNIVKRKYTNDFLLTRTSNFFYDIMVVAGIAAISLDILEKYWGILLILGVAGLIITYVYNRIVAKTLFADYAEEQFLAMYGMLTGTASMGVILLREIDGDFKTPASDNLIYQNFPAIAFGFPLMLLAYLAPEHPGLTLIIFVLFFAVLNIILFRNKIFKRRKNKDQDQK